MMGSTDNILDKATWLAHEAERGGEHLLQAQNELNGIPLGDRAKIAAQMERTSRVDHAKHPYHGELDVKPDPGHKDNYTVAIHKGSPIEGTIRAGHDGQSDFAVTEEVAGTVGGVGGAAYGGAVGFTWGTLSWFLGDTTGIGLWTEAGASTGGLYGAGIGLAIGAGGYGVHKFNELRKEDPMAANALVQQIVHPPLI